MAKKAKATVNTPTSGFYKVELTTVSEMLGSAPADPDLYRKFIVAKKYEASRVLATTNEEIKAIDEAEAKLAAEELAGLPDEGNDKGVTVFRRDKDGDICFMDFQLRGYFKEAAGSIGIDGKTWGLTQKIDRFLFITDKDKKPVRSVKVTRDGNPIQEADTICSRPLRANGPMGVRVCLAASEQINEGVSMTFFVYVLPLGDSDKVRITADVIKEWVGYGLYQGLSQWRTGGMGRFESKVTAL